VRVENDDLRNDVILHITEGVFVTEADSVTSEATAFFGARTSLRDGEGMKLLGNHAIQHGLGGDEVILIGARAVLRSREDGGRAFGDGGDGEGFVLGKHSDGHR
jgi:hypothetical protein